MEALKRTDTFRELLKRFGEKKKTHGTEPERRSKRECRQTILFSPSAVVLSAGKRVADKSSTQIKKNVVSQLAIVNDGNSSRQPRNLKRIVDKTRENGTKRKIVDKKKENVDGKGQIRVDRSNSRIVNEKRKPIVDESSGKRVKRGETMELEGHTSTPMSRSKRNASVNLSNRFQSTGRGTDSRTASLRQQIEDDCRPKELSRAVEGSRNGCRIELDEPPPSYRPNDSRFDRINCRRDEDFLPPSLPSRVSAFSRVPSQRRDNLYDNRDFTCDPRQFYRIDGLRRPRAGYRQPVQFDDSIGPSASQLGSPNSSIRRYNYDIPRSHLLSEIQGRQPYVRLHDFMRNREEERVKQPKGFGSTRDADGFLRPLNPHPPPPPPPQSRPELELASESHKELLETVDQFLNEDIPTVDIAYKMNKVAGKIVLMTCKMLRNEQVIESARQSLIQEAPFRPPYNEQAVRNWVFNDKRHAYE